MCVCVVVHVVYVVCVVCVYVVCVCVVYVTVHEKTKPGILVTLEEMRL